ncbi:hypothetical protein GPX89_32475 [Nocardia sp. ET3-3]|uniref:Proteinase inhibitor I42 chagasin domain-containing protein n=1 Tax=Nocardia terrae TaxID=2675851 RepID=A0A7K1V648_9NOCA|nr:hypothetical protein [Nocardia terrae]MVU81941.1 hypothetical protein [Nocardia terrae]
MKIRVYFAAPVILALTLTSMAVSAPASAQHIALTNSDDGRSVTASLGDDIEVRLTSFHENGLTYTWQPPVSSDSTVLSRTASRTAPNGDASAVLQAENDGTTTITAQPQCRPDKGRECPSVAKQWKVTVQVK